MNTILQRPEITPRGDYMHISGTDFSPAHTFECGQCFRFEAEGGGAYSGVAFGRALRVWRDETGLCVSGDAREFDALWRRFLDIDRDYAAISLGFPGDGFTRAAVEYGRGLRILRQQPWEALCSFIISQCNNIPRIKAIISALCARFGDEVGGGLYAFPAPERLAALDERDLECLRAGYRARYIISAARAVCGGSVRFDALEHLSTDEARAEIMRLEGVGEKVANCFLLFGAGRLDAFPVDTWMKKAAAHYPGGFPAQSFGQYAGIAQQYIFYYARSKKLKNGVDNCIR